MQTDEEDERVAEAVLKNYDREALAALVKAAPPRPGALRLAAALAGEELGRLEQRVRDAGRGSTRLFAT